MRNSWGANWGWRGYFELKKGNTCGVCKNGAIFPYLYLNKEKKVIHKSFAWPEEVPEDIKVKDSKEVREKDDEDFTDDDL